MFYSIRGRVLEITKKFLVVESGNIGYEILVSKPESYLINSEVFLYLHHEIKEEDEFLAGFRTLDEKNAFRLLLHVNGVGPKTALTILSNVEFNSLLVAVSNEDYEFVRSIQGINDRVANQIILDLKDNIVKNRKENSAQYKEIKEALKSLKFKVKDIDRVLPTIYIPDASNEDILKEALRRLGHESLK